MGFIWNLINFKGLKGFYVILRDFNGFKGIKRDLKELQWI